MKVQPAQVQLWITVQWQDSAGNWQNVEGWQGALDSDNKKSWWVAEKDFGKGPFRWAVYQGQGGRLLANSESFSLPDEANEVIRVEIVLTP